MNNRKKIEEMLVTYGKRTAPYTFRVKAEAQKQRPSISFRAVIATACALMLLLTGVTVFKVARDTEVSQGDAQDRGFVISVQATSGNEVELGEEAVCLDLEKPLVKKSVGISDFHKDGSPSSEFNPASGEDVIYKELTTISIESLGLKISGEDIESYDVSSAQGELIWVDFKAREIYKETGAQTDYFHRGSEFENLEPFDEEDPYTYVVSWYPGELLNKDIFEATGVDPTEKNLTLDKMSKISEATDELLQSGEDFTKYFGDVLTVTIHYNDKTTETVEIKITLDEHGYCYVENNISDVVVY